MIDKWNSNLSSLFILVHSELSQLNEHVEVITAAWFGTKMMVFTKKKYGRVWKKMKCSEEVEKKLVKLCRVHCFDVFDSEKLNRTMWFV